MQIGTQRRPPLPRRPSLPSGAATAWHRAVSFPCGESGQALAEFAICLPALFLVVFGIFVFGIAINNFLLLTSAANSGARALALARGATSDPCQLLSSTVSSAAPLLKSSSITYSLALTPSGGTTSTYTGSTCAAATSNLAANASARVTVTYPCSLVVMGQNFATACTLQAVDAELVQ